MPLATLSLVALGLLSPHTVFATAQHYYVTNSGCVGLGVWDQNTGTCTLTRDIVGSIEIDDSSLTLDGGGHTLTVDALYYGGQGITIHQHDGVTIKNLTIAGGDTAIYFDHSSGSKAIHNTIVTMGEGIDFYGVSGGEASGNTISGGYSGVISTASDHLAILNNTISHTGDAIVLNDFVSSSIAQNHIDTVEVGISLMESNVGNDFAVFDNQISHANSEALALRLNSNGAPNGVIHGNTFSDSVAGVTVTSPCVATVAIGPMKRAMVAPLAAIIIGGGGGGPPSCSSSTPVVFYGNFFLRNGTPANVNANASFVQFSRSLPEGGNTWDTYDKPSEGCVDGNHDGFCDSPYVIDPVNNIADQYPHALDPCSSPGTCASNVLFLPGIETSRLYRPDGNGGEIKAWEPSFSDDLHNLYLDPKGKSVYADVYAKVEDVVDEMPITGTNVYKAFITKMNALVASGTINAWEADPYDWRLSIEDILARGKQTDTHISYIEATSTPYIIQELKRLAATSKTGKVTIVAHSNGGLVAKKLTEMLGSDASILIDQMIFVAVPQAGTPAAIAADLHGYDQDFGGGLIVGKSSARTFASTSPMAYNLLPSAQYFTQVDTPVISFDASLPDWIARYGAMIHSQSSLHTFLTDSYGKVDSQTKYTDQPIQMSDSLLTSSEILHADLDVWTPPSGVKLIQIAGWGVPTTIDGVTYKKKDAVAQVGPNFTVDGDGTVVVPSALWTSTTTGAVNYWLDLKQYNTLVNRILGLRLKVNHSSILEVPELLNFITENLLTRSSNVLPQYIGTSIPIAELHDLRLRYALHSPLTLNLYDNQGRHTGVSTTTGRIEEQIPGTYYTEFGDVKYLFSDASSSAQIVMNGYAPGVFTFNIDQYSGDTLTASTTFKNIPTTASTTVSLDVQSDISTLSPMSIDKNGDGIVDAILAPKLGGEVTLDTTPPELQVTFSTATQSIAFIGTDDSGTTTVTTSTSYSTYKKNQKEKEKENHGVATTIVTARDEAGNTTALFYTRQSQSAEAHDMITLNSLAYNGATTTISATSLSYEWGKTKKGIFQEFESQLHTASTTLESQFQLKKNITTIMTRSHDAGDSEHGDSNKHSVKQIVTGMVIPYVKTEKGSLIINF